MNLNTVNLFYQNKIYQVDIGHFRAQSNFNFEQESQLFYLTDQFEGELNLTEEIIISFIDFFKEETIDISTSNVLAFNYLSKKYQIPKLRNLTNKFIEQHKYDILDDFFATRKKFCPVFDEFISANLLDFIEEK